MSTPTAMTIFSKSKRIRGTECYDCGFHFVKAKIMYYEDTGWTEYKLFELIIEDNKMDFLEIKPEMFDELTALHKAYKAAIGENAPTDAELQRLRTALEKKQIHFYGCICDHSLVACCSVSFTYSTFNYGKSGVFEDFYIQPDYRHRGIAKKLVSYAYEQSGVESLTVGCADCDVSMYQALGFAIPLGNLLAFGE